MPPGQPSGKRWPIAVNYSSTSAYARTKRGTRNRSTPAGLSCAATCSTHGPGRMPRSGKHLWSRERRSQSEHHRHHQYLELSKDEDDYESRRLRLESRPRPSGTHPGRSLALGKRESYAAPQRYETQTTVTQVGSKAANSIDGGAAGRLGAAASRPFASPRNAHRVSALTRLKRRLRSLQAEKLDLSRAARAFSPRRAATARSHTTS